jgi:hypothetical protein
MDDIIFRRMEKLEAEKSGKNRSIQFAYTKPRGSGIRKL